MKKLVCILLALAFSVCCAFTFAVFADSETENDGMIVTVGAVESEDGDPVVTVGADTGETVGAIGSEAASEAENQLPVGTESRKEEEIIVNYAAQSEELPNIGWLVWTVCGLLILGCLVIFAFKFIKYKNSK